MRPATSEQIPVLRERRGQERTTTIELFFDLVYVFAVTQLSHRLLAHLTVEGALQTLLLLGLVWQAWVYTTWVTNWLNPAHLSVRALLLALMLISLGFSSAIPHAFDSHGLFLAACYAVMQVGRSIFTVVTLHRANRDDRSLERNFERILCWCILTSGLVVIGGATPGHWREALWLTALVLDVLGGALGFVTPGLGRSQAREWTIEGGHFADRCQAFVLIGLGESVVVTGSTASDSPLDVATVVAFVVAFLATVGLWWAYFDSSADAGAEIIAHSAEPGRLARSAYHYLHPVMVAGIIVTAAADELVLAEPSGHPHRGTALLLLGGTALFLAGHAAFKAVVWRRRPTTRLLAIVLLLVLVPLTRSAAGIVDGVIAVAVLVAIAFSDARAQRPVASRRVEAVVDNVGE